MLKITSNANAKILANILIVGGQSYNGEFYSGDGYEFMREFLINEYEFGNFTDAQVLINDDFNPAENSISSQEKLLKIKQYCLN